MQYLEDSKCGLHRLNEEAVVRRPFSLRTTTRRQVQGALCISIIFTYLCSTLLVTSNERLTTSDYRQFFILIFNRYDKRK